MHKLIFHVAYDCILLFIDDLRVPSFASIWYPYGVMSSTQPDTHDIL